MQTNGEFMNETISDVGAHVLWSHGMGVKKDDKLYRILRDAISPRGYEFHTFAYDEEHENGDLTVRNFDERPPILEAEIKRLDSLRKVGQKLIFLGWSQGCLTTGFVDLEPFDQVVYLNAMVAGGLDGIRSNMTAEDDKARKEKSTEEFMHWPRTDADGTPYTIHVPMTYFPSMHFDRHEAYRRAAAQQRLTVIRGTADSMTGLVGEYEVENADYYDIEGAGHGFGGDETKQRLIDELNKRVFHEL